MAKFRINAGAELETLTQPELDKSLSKFTVAWIDALKTGVRFRRFIVQGTADGTGALTMKGVGPAESMVWSITRFNLANLATAGTVIVQAFINGTQDGDMVKGNFTTTNNSTAHEFEGPGLVLRPGDLFLVTCSGLTASTPVTLTGNASEVPFNNAYALL